MKLTQGMSHRKVATTVGGVLPTFAMNPRSGAVRVWNEEGTGIVASFLARQLI